MTTVDGMVWVDPATKCDRCDHRMSQHATPLLEMRCMVGRKEMREGTARTFCPCDGFVAKP